jgi:hypothetical protein
MYTTYGDHKSAVVERFNRTIKAQIWEHFFAENTREWLEILPQLVEKYNRTTHSTTRLTPRQARKPVFLQYLLDRQQTRLDKSQATAKEPKLQVGDKVRLSRIKGTFEKGYHTNWTRELYIVAEVLKRKGPQRYKVMTWKHEVLPGSFYEEELQKTKTGDIQLVEKVVEERMNKRTKKKEYLVKWLGWGSDHNEWVSEDKLI